MTGLKEVKAKVNWKRQRKFGRMRLQSLTKVFSYKISVLEESMTTRAKMWLLEWMLSRVRWRSLELRRSGM